MSPIRSNTLFDYYTTPQWVFVEDHGPIEIRGEKKIQVVLPPVCDPAWMAQAIQRVNRGLDLLDEHSPNWMSEMNMDTLRLEDGAFCVLGQAFHGYSQGLHSLDISEEMAVFYGFQRDEMFHVHHVDFETRDLDDGHRDYTVLDLVWTYAISHRNSGRERDLLYVPDSLVTDPKIVAILAQDREQFKIQQQADDDNREAIRQETADSAAWAPES